MTRHPPTPTLFPYTTLFRSRKFAARRGHHSLIAIGRLATGATIDSALAESDHLFEALGKENPDEANFRVQLTELQDRKSTRLNSSHGYISYAVFCLKKKIRI